MPEIVPGRVNQVDRCDLFLGQRPWAFAEENASKIDAHWQRRSAESSAFFNGRILMLADFTIANATLTGEFFETDFKDFLYWRETGEQPGCGLSDGFGSALIRSSDGAVLLGLQTPGNINAGLAYLPGGFIDGRDITVVDGRRVIDIRASIDREVAEETGLGAAELTSLPGYTVTTIGTQVSIAVCYQSALTAEILRARSLAHIAAEAKPELADIIIVRNSRDLDRLKMPRYAEVLLRQIFDPRDS
jgi:hypothetical protein